MTRPDATVGCERFRALLDSYLDGEISRAEESTARAHAHGCAACAREVERAIAARSLLRSVAAIGLSSGFRATVGARVRAEQGRRERRGRWLRVLVPALAPVAAAAIAFALWNPTSKLPGSPSTTGVATSAAPDAAAGHPTPEEPSVAIATAPEVAAEPSRLAAKPHAAPTARPVARPRVGASRAVVAGAPHPRDGAPSYLRSRGGAGSAPVVAAPVVTAKIPEPDAVFVASAGTRYSL